MTRPSAFGIMGGYGATGSVVVAELSKSSDARILIGGRDLDRAKAAAAKFGGKVAAAQVDALDNRTLDDFCAQCSIIVNCAGPVMSLQDRVAQAAFRNGCHYVDVAGMTFVKERMLAHHREIADRGLSYVVSAGWMPGLTELLPVYTYLRAKSKLDSIDSLTVYFADSGEWSDNALRDGAWYLHKAGLPKPGYLRKGEWVRVKMSEASRNVDLGDPIGRGRFSLFTMPELDDFGRRLTDCDFFTYSYVPGFQNVMAAMMIALLPLGEARAVRMLRNVFRRNRLPVAGFVIAEARGSAKGRKSTFTGRIVFKEHDDYWINGIVPATVARLIAEGNGVQPGVHFLSAAVDPIAFMAKLRESGVQQVETGDA
jgi:saccharopine dehydrogenase (NAD+, L-lysine forming)